MPGSFLCFPAVFFSEDQRKGPSVNQLLEPCLANANESCRGFCLSGDFRLLCWALLCAKCTVMFLRYHQFANIITEQLLSVTEIIILSY